MSPWVQASISKKNAIFNYIVSIYYWVCYPRDNDATTRLIRVVERGKWEFWEGQEIRVFCGNWEKFEKN